MRKKKSEIQSPVQPEVRQGRVTCPCGGVMHPALGKRLLPEPSAWLWWQCGASPLHITAAIPEPIFPDLPPEV